MSISFFMLSNIRKYFFKQPHTYGLPLKTPVVSVKREIEIWKTLWNHVEWLPPQARIFYTYFKYSGLNICYVDPVDLQHRKTALANTNSHVYLHEKHVSLLYLKMENPHGDCKNILACSSAFGSTKDRIQFINKDMQSEIFVFQCLPNCPNIWGCRYTMYAYQM